MDCIGNHDTPALPEPGTLLCRSCTRRLSRDLDDLAALWPLLDDMLEPGRAAGGGAHGKPGSKPPVNLEVVDLRDLRGETHNQVCGWANIVIEERRLTVRRLDTPEAVQLLRVHREWIVEQPWVDEAIDEIHACAGKVRRATGDIPPAPLGKCPDIDPRGERDACGGPLQWIDGSTAVACARCGSSWAEADLPHILRVVQPTRKFPVPRAWVVAHYGVSLDALRQWIRRGHVRTYTDEQVDLFDVLTRVSDTPA